MYVTFDTHAAIKAMINGGIKEEAAEIFIKTMQKFNANQETRIDSLEKEAAIAPKPKDLNALATREDLILAITGVNQNISDTKHVFLKWMISMFITQLTATASIGVAIMLALR